jgi:rod shape-determining protein MreD
MKWTPFAILAVITITLQTTVVSRLAINGVYPDLMFVLAVHYALWGPWPDAAIAGWILGLLYGTSTAGPAALYAFTYGGTAWAIIYSRKVLFRDHPFTQIIITLLFGLGVQLVAVGYIRLQSSVSRDIAGLFWAGVLTAVFTAVVAPYIHWPLLKLSNWTGLRTAHRAFRPF